MMLDTEGNSAPERLRKLLILQEKMSFSLKYWKGDSQSFLDMNPVEWPRNPKVPFEAVNTRSNIFQAQVVIHRLSQFLFASQVVLGRLHGCMAKQKLNLFKLAPGQVTESCAGAP